MVALAPEVRRRALTATQALARQGSVRAAFVFGSHVEGRADEWSDIDLAAFMDGVDTWEPARRMRLIVDVQKQVGFDVEAHLFPSIALHNAEPGSFVSVILRHGVRIL